MKSVGGAPAPENGAEPTVDVIVREIEHRVVGKRQHSPEHGCLSCSVGMALVFVSIIIWAAVYWYYTPEFHNKPHPLPKFMEDKPAKKLKSSTQGQ